MKTKDTTGSWRSITNIFSINRWEGWTRSLKWWKNLSCADKQNSVGAIIKKWRKNTAVSQTSWRLWEKLIMGQAMLMQSLKIWDLTEYFNANSWLAGQLLSQEFQRNLRKLKAKNKLSMRFKRHLQDPQPSSTHSRKFKARKIVFCRP